MLEAIKRFQNHLPCTSRRPQKLLRARFALGNYASVSERGEDVLHVVALDAVKMEIGRVEFGTQLVPLSFLPDMDAVAARALEIADAGKRNHVFCRAGKFQHTLADPLFERYVL